MFLPGESQGLGSLVGCRLWGRTESDTTEVTQQQQPQSLNDSLMIGGQSPDGKNTFYLSKLGKTPAFPLLQPPWLLNQLPIRCSNYQQQQDIPTNLHDLQETLFKGKCPVSLT